MIVRFDFHENVDRLVTGAIRTSLRIRKPPFRHGAGNHGCVVTIGRQHGAWVFLMRITDHRKERLIHRFAVDRPRRIKNLVTAVL